MPETDAIELIDLEQKHQLLVLEEVNLVSNFIRQEFAIDKLNTGFIGNIAKQLHIHIIERYVDDPYWPNVVWGAKEQKPYTEKELEKIHRAFVLVYIIGGRSCNF